MFDITIFEGEGATTPHRSHVTLRYNVKKSDVHIKEISLILSKYFSVQKKEQNIWTVSLTNFKVFSEHIVYINNLSYSSDII